MADSKTSKRPLSPFMIGPYYRPQLTSTTSIVNRLAGIALLFGGLLIVWWLLAAATSPGYFAFADAVITSWIGDLVMTLSAWALWYHALAGIRHLVWDAGHALEIGTAERFGIVVIVLSVVLTVLTLLIV